MWTGYEFSLLRKMLGLTIDMAIYDFSLLLLFFLSLNRCQFHLYNINKDTVLCMFSILILFLISFKKKERLLLPSSVEKNNQQVLECLIFFLANLLNIFLKHVKII